MFMSCIFQSSKTADAIFHRPRRGRFLVATGNKLRSICPDENQSWSLLKAAGWFFFNRTSKGPPLLAPFKEVVSSFLLQINVDTSDFDLLILKCDHLLFRSWWRLFTAKVRPRSIWPIMSHPPSHIRLCSLKKGMNEGPTTGWLQNQPPWSHKKSRWAL